MIEYVVLALMCLMMLIVIAYAVIATICVIKQHKVQMRINKGIAEAVERRLIELDDGAFVRPHKYDCKMLFIGDSITQGWASSLDSYSYAYRISSFFNAESVIQGIGGAYFNEESFDSLPFDPDIVFVAYGTNDFGHYKTYDELRAHCEAHLGLIAEEYKGKKVFVLSPIWREQRDGKAMGTFEGCRAIIIDAAEKLGLIHIDGLKLVPPLPSLFADGFLHPNDNGFSLYAENLSKEVQKLI